MGHYIRTVIAPNTSRLLLDRETSVTWLLTVQCDTCMPLCERLRASAPRPTLSAVQVDRTSASTAARSSAVTEVRYPPQPLQLPDTTAYSNGIKFDRIKFCSTASLKTCKRLAKTCWWGGEPEVAIIIYTIDYYIYGLTHRITACVHTHTHTNTHTHTHTHTHTRTRTHTHTHTHTQRARAHARAHT